MGTNENRPEPQPKPQSLFLRIFRGIDTIRLVMTNLFFIFFLFVLYGLFSMMRSGSDIASSGSVLTVPLSGILIEQPVTEDPFSGMLTDGTDDTVVSDVVRAFRLAAADDTIREAYIDFSLFYGGSLAQASEIAEAVESFRSAGKHVTAFSGTYSQLDLLIASYADEVIMDPMGSVLLSGFDHYEFFYRDFAEKFDIDFNILKTGEFKGAAEAYSRNGMSEELKAQLSGYLFDLRKRYGDIVEGNRDVEPGAVADYINRYPQLLAAAGGNGAEAALKAGWVDALMTDRELWIEKGYTDNLYEAESDDWFYYTDYLASKKRRPAKTKVAVLTVSGPIHNGGYPDGNASVLVPLLDEAADRSDIAALVIRLDSGGGDVYASEEIRRAVERFRGTGRPVVVSMAGTAASGAYWIATAADAIVATPFTVTGSIGVFGLSPSVSRFLKTRIGISVDGVQTDPGAVRQSLFLDSDPRTLEVRQQELDYIYHRFLTLVSESRGLSFAETEKIAEGKVYTGSQALDIGLVDEAGGLTEAVALALKKAEWDGRPYELEYLSRSMSFSEALLSKSGMNFSALTSMRRSLFSDMLLPATGNPAALFHPVDVMEMTPKKGVAF